jgi:predicted O-methyltransferase YrrM
LAAGEIDFLASIENRGAHPGTIGLRDYLFLSAFASILAPERAVEIGTLAGFSAAIIAAALHRRHPNSKSVLVETIDKNTHSVAENDKQVGFQIPEIIPDFSHLVRVHAPAESEAIKQFAARGEFQFVFIDANHQHPQPLLDLLRAAPYVCNGGWILLTTSNWARLVAQAPRAITMCAAERHSERNGSSSIGHSAKSLAETSVRFKCQFKRPP